jgi:CYTH domain-containing protein
VRVEQSRSLLILLTQTDNGQFSEEQADVPLSHAEALMNVAAGMIAFDRTALSLGGDSEAYLDRFIMPEGLDILTVTIPANPHMFVPLSWFGLEVTDEPAFEARDLALAGAPHITTMEPSDAALNALLDALESSTHHHFRSSFEGMQVSMS